MDHLKGKDFWKVLPFFLVLGLLTLAAYCIPLRPTVSYTEKRTLTQFPEFTLPKLVSGEYFQGITLWFSDTFPGRETWLNVSAEIQNLYGSSDVYVAPALPDVAEVPEIQEEPAQPEKPETAPAKPQEETQAQETTPATDATEEQKWGGVDAGAAEEIGKGAVIQIGDSAFNQMGMNEGLCKRYGQSLSRLAELLPDVRVISAPAPTAIGVMVEPQYLENLNCAQQDLVQNTLHENMSDAVVKVDVFSNLVSHNSEYIYFRTDHHWTALGAYYAYEAICQATDQAPAPLDSFTPWDQGTFTGSLYGQARWPHKLKKDDCIAYIPQGDITMMVKDKGSFQEMPLLRDMTKGNENEKYVTFLSSDHALCEITNNSLPEGTACLLVKDSFGNCLAPFLTQNYHKVYAMDYRKYGVSGLKYFVENNDVQDVIFSPYLIATQSILGNDLISGLCN